MELKLSKIKSIKDAEEKLKEIRQHVKDVYEFERQLLEKLSLLKSRQYFEFPDGLKVPYSEITLVICNYTEKGLGYSDDVEHFSEFQFTHPNSQYNVRFLSDESIKKFGIPHEERDYYGKPRIFQKNSGDDYVVFVRKFKNIVNVNDKDPPFTMTDEQKTILRKRLINL